jgi:Arc/MetJ-type ribon-helix-helix transcriptional regulator
MLYMTFSLTDPCFNLSSAASQWYPSLMTIALAKDVEEFLQEQVRAGVAGDPSELAYDVLRCVRDQQRRPFEITPQLEAWLLESADQPATPLTKADFDGIRQRARKRNPASKA